MLCSAVAKLSWQLKWQMFVAVGSMLGSFGKLYVGHSLLRTLIIEYFWQGCFAPPIPPPACCTEGHLPLLVPPLTSSTETSGTYNETRNVVARYL